MSITSIYSIVDVFWGNGPVQSVKPEGTVRGWNWLKAQTGNTHPGALLPYGWVSACPYSGAYPTGYGVNGFSCNGPAPTVFDRKAAWGITHFHVSGTGFIGQFYNYLLCTPSSPSANTNHISDLVNENARPGHYAATLADYGVDFELTTTPFAAIHRYHFHEGRGHLAIDLNAVGLRLTMGTFYKEKIDVNSATRFASNAWQGYISTNGMRIWFAVKAKGDVVKTALYNSVIEYDFATPDAEIFIGFSLVGQENAEQHAQEAVEQGFEAARNEAAQKWTALLERIRAEFPDNKQRSRFYSCLYHSLVKPIKSDDGYIDFVTMWDTHHTQLPLTLSIAHEYARDIMLSMLDTNERFGFFPNLYYMHRDLNHESNQATALSVYTLCDGFMRGILTKDDYPRVKRALVSEFDHANIEGKSPTHRLDLGGAYRAAAFIATHCGDDDFAKQLMSKKDVWKLAYDSLSGYLIKDATYYEGNYRNYSFRPHVDMAQRIALAGGTARFNEMLDDFFTIGYDGPETPELRPIREGYFEAMNNESDMDAPMAYLWCGRADRVAEINDLIRRFQFTDGAGGAPGNVDSGALSSWYVWSCLGVYPLAGTPYYLLGSPSVNNAEIDLAQGTLHISVLRESPSSIYPTGYDFNGVSFKEPWLAVSELEKGGSLVFHLADKPSAPSPIPDWL